MSRLYGLHLSFCYRWLSWTETGTGPLSEAIDLAEGLGVDLWQMSQGVHGWLILGYSDDVILTDKAFSAILGSWRGKRG